MNKKHVDRSRALIDKAECGLCGAMVSCNDDAMSLHVLARHPMELISHPAFIRTAGKWAYGLGEKLSEVIHGKRA